MPKHDIYIEPFFGSGAIYFAKKPSRTEIINDINDLLVNFWNVIKDDMAGFLEKFDYALHSRTMFEDYKESDWKNLDRVEKAFRFYYLVRNAWCRLYRVNNKGKFNAPFAGALNSGLLKGDRNLARQFFDSTQMIKIAHERLKRTCIECLDYKDIFKKYDRDNVLYFLDPPYSTTYQYCVSFNIDELVNELSNIKGKFILTLNSELKGKFEGYNITETNPSSKMKATNPNDTFSQVIITNFHVSINIGRELSTITQQGVLF